jgi:hypothetical protein
MGNSVTRTEKSLIEEIEAIRDGYTSDTMSAAGVLEALDGVRERVRARKADLSEAGRERVLAKLAELIGVYAVLRDGDELERKRQEADRSRRAEGEARRELARNTSDLVGLYTTEYGESAVKNLLEVGRRNGGYRNPRQGLDLAEIQANVHALAYSRASGVSHQDSTSNGLVNRIREQSGAVVRDAYNLGYDVENAKVREALAALAYHVALSLPSDSGGREEKKEHRARGMAYMEMPDLANNNEYLGKSSQTDPGERLRELERELAGVESVLGKASGERAVRLRAQRDVLKEKIAEIKKQQSH